MNDWNIQGRAHHCQACEKPFADKEPLHTLLVTERHQYVRRDVCQNCWQSQYGEGTSDRKGFISHWQSVYHVPPPAPPEPIKRETAENLLRKLIEEGQPKDGPVCYILAVMLERKRILKVKEQLHREGQRIFIYEHPPTGDLFTIADPNLRMDQLEQVQHDVVLLLNPPAPAPAPAPAPVEETAATPAEPQPAEPATN